MNAVTGTLLEGTMTTDTGVGMSEAETYLPEMEESGRRGVWEIEAQDGSLTLITGRFLGMGSSHRPEHKNHPGARYALPGVHCSTCRWTETRLFQDRNSVYYLVRCGASEVEGEEDRVQVTRITSPLEVVETMAVTDPATRRPVLPPVARRALAQAASHDGPLRDAYLNSPVTRP